MILYTRSYYLIYLIFIYLYKYSTILQNLALLIGENKDNSTKLKYEKQFFLL